MRKLLLMILFATVASRSIALEMVFFNAQQEYENTVNISWQTSIEINSDYFIVEKSYNLNDWIPVGRVEAAKNSIESNSYSLLDMSPMRLNYYRLKQVDADGKFKYYGHVQVLINYSFKEKAEMAILPNNADGSGTIKFAINNDTPISLSICNEKKQVVEKMEIENALNKGVYYIAYKSLPAGNYTVTLNGNGISMTDKLVSLNR